jgi:peptidylprolyl isomerase
MLWLSHGLAMAADTPASAHASASAKVRASASANSSNASSNASAGSSAAVAASATAAAPAVAPATVPKGAPTASTEAPPSAPPKSGLAAILEAAPPEDWRKPNPENTLYMELPGGRVVIELAPMFAPQHVANIRALAREGYFDGLQVMRSQDNYVVQWGDPNEKNPVPIKTAKRHVKAEFSVPVKRDFPFTRLPDRDGYAPKTGFSDGFPVGYDSKTGQAWMTHCYGMVGSGRDNDEDSGGGTELYAVNGHAPRHLDRNVTLVGRVIDGMPLLSTIARGKAPFGFFTEYHEFVPIRQIVLAADVPEKERSKLELLKTDSKSFKAAVEALRNRKGDWYKTQAGHIEVCNIPPMVRTIK